MLGWVIERPSISRGNNTVLLSCIVVDHLVLCKVFRLKSSKPFHQKLIVRKIQLQPHEQPHGLGLQRDMLQKGELDIRTIVG